MNDDVLSYFRAYFDLDEAQLDENTSFRQELAFDEIDLFEIFLAIEERFGCEIPDAVADGLDSIAMIRQWLADQGIDVEERI